MSEVVGKGPMQSITRSQITDALGCTRVLLKRTSPTSLPIVFDGPDRIGETVLDDPSGVGEPVSGVKQ